MKAFDSTEPLQRTRERMGSYFSANQVLGRTQSIGCVAVEITQRCNLDCSLCYLSESSENVVDLPLVEIYRRLDAIVEHYGSGVHVQITGGDPTLRKHSELVEIVRYASNIGLYPALFTNGIAASRSLLEKLSEVGLCDVVFHVDSSQGRKGYSGESELNKLRLEYIKRARGLGLMIIFNTTVHHGNIESIPGLVQFFLKHADEIGFCSFQLQADTGRGEWKKRDVIVSQESVRQCIEKSARRKLPWGVIQIGHHECHSYMPTWVVNQQVYPVIDNRDLFEQFLDDFRSVNTNRHERAWSIVREYSAVVLQKPRWIFRLFQYIGRQCLLMKGNLLLDRGKVKKLSFFIQNFMDRDDLQTDRLEACSFMVMTAEGPLSMCEHNARRDEFILKPVQIHRADGSTYVFAPVRESTAITQGRNIARSASQ